MRFNPTQGDAFSDEIIIFTIGNLLDQASDGREAIAKRNF